MYAVFRLFGFQYGADEGTILEVPRLDAEKGSTIEIDEVLLIRDGETATVGTPLVPNAKIQAEVLDHGKDDKVLVFKFKRRTKYRRTQGHRRDHTRIQINKIEASAS